MKKIIPFCLAISVSSSFLLAQNGNRLKATNQVTGCRLQVVGNRKAELPSEDQIGQQVKTTTNYELPTTNCNNQGNDLDCYMTMNPAELKNIEEGIENLRGMSRSSGELVVSARVDVNTAEVQGASEVEDVSVQSGGQQVSENPLKYQALKIYCKHWLENVGAFEAQPSYANKALESGTTPQLVEAFNTCCDHVKVSLDSGVFLALSWIQIAEDLQNVIDESIKGSHSTTKELSLLERLSQPRKSSDSTGGISFLDRLKASRCSAVLVQQVTVGVQNATEEIPKSSDSTQESSLLELLKGSKNRVNPVSQIAESLQKSTIEDSPKSNRLLELLSAIQDSMKIVPPIKSPSLLDKLKASRKDESSIWGIPDTVQLVKYKVELIQSLVLHQRPEIVNAWEKIVKQSQRFENYRSDRAYILEANKITPYFREECKNLLEKTVYSLKKSTIADQEGKQSIASLWLNLTRANQLFFEYRQNRENFKPLKGDALDLDKGRVHCLESTQSMLEKAMIADQRGKQEEVALYEKAASQYQAAAENCRKTTETYLGMQELGCSFLAASEAAQSSADELKLAADGLGKAFEVEAPCSSSTSVTLKTSSESQLLSSISHLPSSTAAAVSSAYSLQPIPSIWPVGRIVINSEPQLLSSISDLPSPVAAATPPVSTRSAGRIVSNNLRDTALGIYCEHWLGEVGATKKGGSAYANKALECGVDPQLVEAFNEYCNKVHVSLDSGGLLALSWIQVAEDLQNAIEGSIFHLAKGNSLFAQLSRARAPTRTTPATLQLVNYKVELIESSVLRQRLEIVNAWENIVRNSQHLVEKYRRAEVLEANKDRSWFNSDHCKEYEGLLEKAACCLTKGTMADQEDKQSLASLWFNLIRENQRLLEHWQNRDHIKNLDFFIAEARYPDKVIIRNLENTQTMLEKAMIADQRGGQEEATLYEQAASQYQEAAENFRTAAEAYLIMKESARGFLAAVGFFKSSADGLKLAAEALEKAFLWQKTAEQYQVAAMYEQQAAEAYTQGNTANGDHFHEEASKVWKVAREMKTP